MKFKSVLSVLIFILACGCKDQGEVSLLKGKGYLLILRDSALHRKYGNVDQVGTCKAGTISKIYQQALIQRKDGGYNIYEKVQCAGSDGYVQYQRHYLRYGSQKTLEKTKAKKLEIARFNIKYGGMYNKKSVYFGRPFIKGDTINLSFSEDENYWMNFRRLGSNKYELKDKQSAIQIAAEGADLRVKVIRTKDKSIRKLDGVLLKLDKDEPRGN